MKKSQVIIQVILSSCTSCDPTEAHRLFRHEFLKHFPYKDLKEWDTEVATHISRAYLLTVDAGRDVNVKALIEELDILCAKMQS